MSACALRRWVERCTDKDVVSLTVREELRKLRRENQILRQEREILRKSALSSRGQCNTGQGSSLGRLQHDRGTPVRNIGSSPHRVVGSLSRWRVVA